LYVSHLWCNYGFSILGLIDQEYNDLSTFGRIGLCNVTLILKWLYFDCDWPHDIQLASPLANFLTTSLCFAEEANIETCTQVQAGIMEATCWANQSMISFYVVSSLSLWNHIGNFSHCRRTRLDFAWKEEVFGSGYLPSFFIILMFVICTSQVHWVNLVISHV